MLLPIGIHADHHHLSSRTFNFPLAKEDARLQVKIWESKALRSAATYHVVLIKLQRPLGPTLLTSAMGSIWDSSMYSGDDRLAQDTVI
jgi:hypothetical protein